MTCAFEFDSQRLQTCLSCRFIKNEQSFIFFIIPIAAHEEFVEPHYDLFKCIFYWILITDLGFIYDHAE